VIDITKNSRIVVLEWKRTWGLALVPRLGSRPFQIKGWGTFLDVIQSA
jgi:hypothetical protein